MQIDNWIIISMHHTSITKYFSLWIYCGFDCCEKMTILYKKSRIIKPKLSICKFSKSMGYNLCIIKA